MILQIMHVYDVYDVHISHIIVKVFQPRFNAHVAAPAAQSCPRGHRRSASGQKFPACSVSSPADKPNTRDMYSVQYIPR